MVMCRPPKGLGWVTGFLSCGASVQLQLYREANPLEYGSLLP